VVVIEETVIWKFAGERGIVEPTEVSLLKAEDTVALKELTDDADDDMMSFGFGGGGVSRVSRK
jgi:hypothetical protein